MKKENKKAAASTPKFDIKVFPQIEWPNKKTGKIEKFYIIPDDLFEEHLKELPNGTFNESKQFRAFNGGKLYQLGSNPEKDAAIQSKGREANASTWVQRHSFKEEADILLSRVDKETGKTGLENITIAMYERAMLGDVKAYTALRDTAGEKPADTVDLNANVMTEADKALMDKLKARMIQE